MMTAAISNTDVSVILQDEFVALIAFLFLYLTYYFGSDFGFVKKFRRRFRETREAFEKSVYFRRTLGFVLLGIIPFFIALFFFDEPITAYGIGIPSGQNAYLWFLVPTVVIAGGCALRPGKKIDTSYYPEVRQKTWTRRRTTINLLFWAIYLLGYEFAIRGMLFFTSLYAFGLWPAIIINSVIYSLIHIFKGPQEAYGAFFLGIVFCLITYYTDSFWIAFVIHFLLAAINDLKAVKSSPEMIYDFGKKP